MEEKDNHINIILENSTHAQHYFTVNNNQYNYNTLIHNEEFNRVITLIKKIVPENENAANRKNLHNTITILGSRGSGKTSFLLSVKHQLELAQEPLSSDVQVLDIIDPTLIEEKGHVFLNVISRIKNLVEKRLDKYECNPDEDESLLSRKKWRQTLNKLAAGLPSIDGIGDSFNESWQDPEFVMDNGLVAVSASFELSDNFNLLLKQSLSILNKKVFLLMFDDIDVDSTKGWAVLETIRKYFTGAQLITMISGDLKLYSTVIRQQKWKNFGKEILEYEGKQLGRLPIFSDVVTQLESQYLQKILQPSSRVHLPTIIDIKKNRKVYVCFDKNNISDGQLIDTVYKEKILSPLGIKNVYQADTYLNFLLGLPIRTQVQILSIFHLNSESLSKSTQMLSLFDVFISDLYINDIDPETLKQNNNLNRIILQFLLKEQRLDELYQLQPITTDSSLNSTLLSLNFNLTYKMQSDPFVIFDYLIRIGYIRNLVPILGYKNGDQSSFEPSFLELCKKDIILSDRVLKDITGKIIAYVRGHIDKDENSENISKVGTIPLFGMADKAKRKKQTTSDRIDSVLKNSKANFLEWLLVYMPLSSNQYAYKQTSLLTYSPYLLFGAIGELCRKSESGDLKNGFSELSQLRAYVMPDFKRGANDDYETPEESYQDFPDKIDGFVDIEALFQKWVKKYEMVNTTSVHLIGKVVTRYFYALTNIENKIGKRSLGEVFHSQLIAFMNAALIEDCRENSTLASDLNINNTNFSDKIFTDNLKKVIPKKEEKKTGKLTNKAAEEEEGATEINKVVKDSTTISLTFSKWLLSCPLILVYLKKDDHLKKLLIEYCSDFVEEEIFLVDVYRILSKIQIRSTDETTELSLLAFNQSNYDAVFKILTQNNITIDQLEYGEVNDIKRLLKNIGINLKNSSSIDAFIKRYKK